MAGDSKVKSREKGIGKGNTGGKAPARTSTKSPKNKSPTKPKVNTKKKTADKPNPVPRKSTEKKRSVSRTPSKASLEKARKKEKDMQMIKEIITRLLLLVGMGIVLFGCIFALKIMNSVK